jgi:hypothetical protein
VEKAKKNQNQKRKRVQAKYGEILTEETCAARLEIEEQTRNAKSSAKNKGIKGKTGLVKSSNAKAQPKEPAQSKESAQPKESAATRQSLFDAKPHESDTDSELEVVRPRKSRRKLVPLPSDDEQETNPDTPKPHTNEGKVLAAMQKLIDVENSEWIQDFEDEMI